MGIKNLKNILNNYCYNYVVEKNLKEYDGKKLAIDSSIFIYKSLYNNSDILDGMTRIILRFLKNGITPFFVFDGKPPEEKNFILQNRKDRKNQLINKKQEIENLIEENNENSNIEDLKNELNKVNKNIININDKHFILLYKLLDLFGIQYIIADGEGEAFCAKMYQKGLVDGCVSEDSDILVNGGKIFIRNFNPEKNVIEEYNLDIILTNLEITFEQFIDLCILCGCDYTTKINGVGPITAFKLIKSYNNIENIIEWIQSSGKYEIPDDFNYEKARYLFNYSFDEFNFEELDIKMKKPKNNELLLFLRENSDNLKDKYYFEIEKMLSNYYEHIINNNIIIKKKQMNLFSYFKKI